MASGSKLLDVAHCLLLHQLFLLCFGFIGASSNSMNSASAELRPQVVEALLMLPKLCHLDNDLEIIMIQRAATGRTSLGGFQVGVILIVLIRRVYGAAANPSSSTSA